MEVKVISEFRDKETGKLHKVGATPSFEDENRIADLVARGLVEEPKKEPAKKGKA